MGVDPRFHLLYKQGDCKNLNLNFQLSMILNIKTGFNIFCVEPVQGIFIQLRQAYFLRSRVEAVHVHTARVSLLLKHE